MHLRIKLNPLDWSLLGVGLVIALGVMLVQGGVVKTSSQVVRGETDIETAVILRNIKTMNPNLFEPGKTLSITIRNQPRGEVRIVDVQRTAEQIVLPTAAGTPKLVPDPSEPNTYDYILHLRDHAIITPDGYVTEGIKVKTGLPIEVEGFNYRMTGVIADVQPVAP